MSNPRLFFLECSDNNLLTQVTEEPMKEDALWALMLMSKEEIIWNAKARGGLGCSDLEMVDFRILKVRIKANSRMAILKFRRVDFGLFMGFLERIPWDTVLERREIQETWMIFKNYLLRDKEQSILIFRTTSKGGRKPAYTNKEFLTEVKYKK